MQQRLIEALRQGFPADAWALVIGDLMLDRYLWGKVERISPEAPVPVVLLEKESSRPGGAANVAANLAGLGLPCRLLGTVGDDAPGRELVAAIASQGVGTEALFTSSSRPTTTKTRILGGHQQMLRLDREATAAPDAGEHGSQASRRSIITRSVVTCEPPPSVRTRRAGTSLWVIR